MQPQSPPTPTPVSSEAPTLPEVPVAAPTAPVASASVPAAQPTDSAPGGNTAAPAMADDGDLIEKEWVSKVKQIVDATGQDPFEQNKQFTKLKADYMQKRYGKSIKLDE